MEPRARDRSTVENLLVKARERLSALGALLDTGGEIGAPRRAGCGYRAMSDAALCLPSSRRLSPTRTS